MVIRQDESARAIRTSLVDADGERALAFGQDCGQVSGIRLDELVLVDGFVRDEGFPNDGANCLGKAIRRLVP
jgi:hypothetical protein